MEKVLLTGATGFVGSALAASFLARSMPVLALSRNDPDGERTKRAVQEAALGFGLDISGKADQYLEIIEVDFSDLENCISPAALVGVQQAWHCAAEMSYSANRLAASFEVNVGNSTRLFELLHAHAPALGRFYYVSTAFVAGMHGGVVEEQLHVRPHLINAYQVSKWCAEKALHLLHLKTGMPLTIFRPSVVVGHRHTGWAPQNGFGFYMFMDAVRAYAANGGSRLTMEMEADIRPDLVSIDQLVEDAVGLTVRESGREECEVFHCAGGLTVSTRELMERFAAASGVELCFGTPVTAKEQEFERAIELNLPFANREWQFSREALDRVLDRRAPPEALALPDISRLCAWRLEQESGLIPARGEQGKRKSATRSRL